MLWPVPLPKISTLFKTLCRIGNNKNSWNLRKYEDPMWFCGGSEALSSVCRQIVKKKSRTASVMLPAYFCGQSLRYLRQIGVDFIFYDLTDELNPDYEKISKILEEEVPDIFLHVHYFGRITSQIRSRELCTQHNILMIEDCSHVIHPSVIHEWLGDILIFSPHKFFPVAYIGVLYLRKTLEIDVLRRKSKFPFFWYLTKFSRNYILPMGSKHNDKWGVKWSSQSEPMNSSMPASIEVAMLNNEDSAVNIISKCRKYNKNKLLKVLLSFDEWRPIVNFGQNDIPYILGMRCSSAKIASELYSEFNRLKSPVMMWPDLPDELNKLPLRHTEDFDRTQETIFFFLHEQIDIDKYLKLVSKVIGERQEKEQKVEIDCALTIKGFLNDNKK